MPKTIQIRDVSDETYVALKRQAAFEGMSVPDYVRRELNHMACLPSQAEWNARVLDQPKTRISSEQVIAILDEMRGPWPDAGG